jgi:hypothetical protein
MFITPLPQAIDEAEQEGRADDRRDHAEFQLGMYGQEANGNIGSEQQNRSAKSAHQKQTTGPRVHEGTEDMGHDQSDKSDRPRHRDRAADRERGASDEFEPEAQ